MFSVWEPILPTDWSKPGSSVLGRLSDPRVRQFWDSGHAVAGALKSSLITANRKPECCERNGVLWDLAAVYPPGARWEETLPVPVFINGAVTKTSAELESAISKAKLPKDSKVLLGQ
ncbi:MAG: hypothetical protein H7039_24655 [Bryobacteraceae bacterium]|nr:hypothetical protein [Bryobacteraceae bacterium]